MSLKTLFPGFKYQVIKKHIRGNIKILDVGAGNHSVKHTKLHFPDCIYHGIDLPEDLSNDNTDYKLMDKFFEMNLEELNFDEIPDNYYDLIVCSHVVEHLRNGDEVIKRLTKKLTAGGIIYLEWPGLHSTKLPKMNGTLNFFQDSTHVRLYDLKEMYNIMLEQNLTYVEGGKRRSIRQMLEIPLRIMDCMLHNKKITAYIFWDLFGFAEYCVFKNQKKNIKRKYEFKN